LVHVTTALYLLGPLAAAQQDLCCFISCIAADDPAELTGGFLDFFLSMYCIQHCFTCRTSDSTVSEDAGIEPQDGCDFGFVSQTLQPVG
jgi:hypothetical protein